MVAPRSNNLRPVEKYHYDIFHRTGAKLHWQRHVSNFSAHIMTMQAKNIHKNTYAKRYIREIYSSDLMCFKHYFRPCIVN